MFNEQRKSPRRSVSRFAKIKLANGTPERDCLVTDISEGGVRLHVEGVQVPERFALLLADGEGRVEPRDCRVVWRLGCEVGAKFLDMFERERGSADGQAAPGAP